MKKSLNRDRGHTLIGVIGTDLLRYGKLRLFLFICIIVTALSVITSVHYTRILRVQLEQLFLEHDLLDAEWNNLILEECSLGDYRQTQATERILQTKHINQSQKTS